MPKGPGRLGWRCPNFHHFQVSSAQGEGFAPRCKLEVAGKELPNKSPSYKKRSTHFSSSFHHFTELLLKFWAHQGLRSVFESTLVSLEDLGFHLASLGVATSARVLQVQVHRELSFDPLSAPNPLGSVVSHWSKFCWTFHTSLWGLVHLGSLPVCFSPLVAWDIASNLKLWHLVAQAFGFPEVRLTRSSCHWIPKRAFGRSTSSELESWHAHCLVWK